MSKGSVKLEYRLFQTMKYEYSLQLQCFFERYFNAFSNANTGLLCTQTVVCLNNTSALSLQLQVLSGLLMKYV